MGLPWCISHWPGFELGAHGGQAVREGCGELLWVGVGDSSAGAALWGLVCTVPLEAGQMGLWLPSSDAAPSLSCDSGTVFLPLSCALQESAVLRSRQPGGGQSRARIGFLGFLVGSTQHGVGGEGRVAGALS